METIGSEKVRERVSDRTLIIILDQHQYDSDVRKTLEFYNIFVDMGDLSTPEVGIRRVHIYNLFKHTEKSIHR